MTAFVGTDPRGLTVVLTDEAWAHAQEGHAAEFCGQLRTVMAVLQEPQMILDNPQSLAAPRRTAVERYVRFEPGLEGHVVVPTKILRIPEIIRGYGTVGPGTRLATTAYVNQDEPKGRVLWSATT